MCCGQTSGGFCNIIFVAFLILCYSVSAENSDEASKDLEHSLLNEVEQIPVEVPDEFSDNVILDDKDKMSENLNLLPEEVSQVAQNSNEYNANHESSNAEIVDNPLQHTNETPNISENNVNKSVNNNSAESKVDCVLKILMDGEIPEVKIMNSSSLLKALTPIPNITIGECAVVLFYSQYCVFSARVAPHFNALPRVFPPISFYAIDAVVHSNLHMRYGLVAVPTVLLFHNGRAIAKFNDTYSTLDRFVKFVGKYTGLSAEVTVNVTSADMSGPVPAALTKRIDYYLVLSWFFTIGCICFLFMRSSLCHRIVESIKNTWREAEAQHEHEE